MNQELDLSCSHLLFIFMGYFLAQGDAIGYRTPYLWHVGGQTRRLNSEDCESP